MIACGGAQYAQKVLRYGKLGDVVGGQEKAGEGDEHGAVYEDRPVLRKKRVPDVHQRIPQQGRQLHWSAAAGQVQSVQQHRKFIQRPECCQQCNDHKTQDDGRGNKNVRSIAVVQVMHGREPECQRPQSCCISGINSRLVATAYSPTSAGRMTPAWCSRAPAERCKE